MKLYDSQAVNPRRVRIFLSEKNLLSKITLVPVGLGNGEHRSEEFAKLNPFKALPALGLPDGTVIAESISICRYFEDLYPENPLFGETAEEKALVDMWSRRVEAAILNRAANYFHYATDGLNKDGYKNKDWGNFSIQALSQMLPIFEEQLSSNTFLAGNKFSVADISLLCALDFALFLEAFSLEEYSAINNWYEMIKKRESTKA